MVCGNACLGDSYVVQRTLGPSECLSGVLQDLDGDGYDDAIYGCQLGESLEIYWGNAAGILGDPFSLDAGRVSPHMGFGDVDEDGYKDIVVAVQGMGPPYTDRLRTFFGGPSRSFPRQADVMLDGNPRTMVLADLDHDGHLDVLVTNWMGDGMLRALNGKTGKELWRFETGDWIYHGISAADLDGDQAPEILVTDRAGTVTLLEGESGVVAWQVQLNNEAKGMVFGPTTLVDSDGEGALEIVVCGRNLHVLDAKGKLRWEKSFGYRSMARGVSAADVDGDGNQDLVFGEGQNLRALRAKDGEQLWAWDLGDPDKPGDHIDHAPLLADFDGDGFLDVFVVIGRGRSGEEAKNNRGRAWALHAGKGKASPTNTWTTFRGSNRRLGHRLP